MKFGNAAWGFRETPLEQQLKITSDMGLRVLELGIANAPNDIKIGDDTKVVKELYRKYGIELICAATGNDFTTGTRDDVTKIMAVIDMCQDLGVRYLRIFAGFAPVSDVVGEVWDNMIYCLKTVAEYAKEKGVIPVIETHGGVNSFEDGGVEHFHTTSTTLETLKKMLNALPLNIGINYDPANLYAVGIENPDSFYQEVKDRVCYVHMKDFAPMQSGHIKPAACGESNMNWKGIIDGIGKSDVLALFEYENTEDIADGCKRSYDYIKKFI